MLFAQHVNYPAGTTTLSANYATGSGFVALAMPAAQFLNNLTPTATNPVRFTLAKKTDLTTCTHYICTGSSGSTLTGVSVFSGTDQAYSTGDVVFSLVYAEDFDDLQNAGFLVGSNNLSDVADVATARTNLGLGSAATQPSSAFDSEGSAAAAQAASLQKSANLSDLSSVPTALANLGLAPSATIDTTDASNISSGTLIPARMATFGASGPSHSTGAVPDPGSTAGATRYLREDASWAVPAGGGGGSPGGTNGQIQYNNLGTFGGSANLIISSTLMPNFPATTNASPAAGDVWGSSSTGMVSHAPAAGWTTRIPRRIYSGSGFSSVSNTSGSFVSLLQSPTWSDGSPTIPAGAITQGSVLYFELLGAWGSAATATNWTMEFLLGTIVICISNQSTATAGQSAGVIYPGSVPECVFGAVGSGGTAWSWGRLLMETGTGQLVTAFSLYSGAGGPGATVFSIDTTVALTIDFRVKMGTASSSNFMQIYSFSAFLR